MNKKDRQKKKNNQKKKNKKKRYKYIQKFKSVQRANNVKIQIPYLEFLHKKNENKRQKIDTQSWFKIRTRKTCTIHLDPDMNTNITDEDTTRQTINVILHPTKEQHNILQRWYKSYILMYNAAIKYIKNQYNQNKKYKINFYNLRSSLIDEKNQIIEDSQVDYIEYDTKIKSHFLDYATKTACANYKSALTNLKKGNIRHFRIRYWRHNKFNKMMDIELQYFKNGSFCERIFGAFKAEYDGQPFDLELIQSKYKVGCKLNYDSNTGVYNMYIPVKVKIEDNKNPKKFISLDPGIRTFMTGLSEDEVISVGNNISSKIKSYLRRIDKISKFKISDNDIPPKLLKNSYSDIKVIKKIKLYRRKIKNLVTDLHWKTIKYLTNTYRHILVGDMSTRGITSNNRIPKIVKRIAYCLEFYKFRQRLEYKCNLKRIGYLVVDEKYTSKMCSLCGWVDDHLDDAKVFNCKKCGLKLGRDENGARNIFLKQYMLDEELLNE
jgi:putative transposase